MSVMRWICSSRTRAKLSIASTYTLVIIACAICFVQIELGWAADIQVNSRAEAWVLKRVLAGQVADLDDPSAHLPKTSDRVLSVSFLERLLTDPSQSVKVQRRGVDIRHAVFQEEIDLRFAKVPYPVSLTACAFLKKVDLSFSMFENLSFSKSTFTEANFNSMKVGGIARFKYAEFAGPVNFGLADIASNFEAQEAHFRNAKQAANFDSMKVGGAAWFIKTEFRGAFNFGDMTYRGIRASKDTDQDWLKSLITLVNRSRYNAATYTNLEAFLKRVGYPDYADEVFIEQKWRERGETLP